jgi:hypothetical protein
VGAAVEVGRNSMCCGDCVGVDERVRCKAGGFQKTNKLKYMYLQLCKLTANQNIYFKHNSQLYLSHLCHVLSLSHILSRIISKH